MTDAGVFRTTEELEEDPYPSNIRTACLYWLEDDELYNPDVEDNTVADDWITDGSDLVAAAKTSDNRDLFVWPCDVLFREKDENDNYFYNVEILQNDAEEEETVWFVKDYPRILTNVTKDIIQFRTNAYMSDQHLRDVFRSHLRIPNEIFPQQWKDMEE